MCVFENEGLTMDAPWCQASSPAPPRRHTSHLVHMLWQHSLAGDSLLCRRRALSCRAAGAQPLFGGACPAQSLAAQITEDDVPTMPLVPLPRHELCERCIDCLSAGSQILDSSLST
jgi:hypothetical protein